MPDGPDYETVFKRMQCLHGGNPEDVRIIVRYLRFFKGQGGYDGYLAHYLPMLSADVAAEFTEDTVEPVIATETVVVTTEEIPKPTPKKRGRPAKSTKLPTP